MKITKAHALINALAIGALLVSILFRSSILTLILTGICLAGALIVLYRNLASLTNISVSNPKYHTVRLVTITNIIILAAVILTAILMEKGIITLTDRQSKYLLSLLLSFMMIGFGNIAPKLPFNRFTGLRLPWTVRDEDTWIIAHRILGYLSLPLGILCLSGMAIPMPMEQWAKIWFMGPLFLWIGIPAVFSGIYYWKKFSGRL